MRCIRNSRWLVFMVVLFFPISGSWKKLFNLGKLKGLYANNYLSVEMIGIAIAILLFTIGKGVFHIKKKLFSEESTFDSSLFPLSTPSDEFGHSGTAGTATPAHFGKRSRSDTPEGRDLSAHAPGKGCTARN